MSTLLDRNLGEGQVAEDEFQAAAEAVKLEFRASSRTVRLRCMAVREIGPPDDGIYALEVARFGEMDWTWEGARAGRRPTTGAAASPAEYRWSGEVVEVDDVASRIYVRSQRERWFDRGRDAFQRLAPTAPPVYPCPLCEWGFPRSAIDLRILTFDHAPPESHGGRPVCLTCSRCNSTAGHTVDVHMRRRETVTDSFLGTMTEPRPARFHVGGASMVARYYNGPAGILVEGIPKANRPSAPEASGPRCTAASAPSVASSPSR